MKSIYNLSDNTLQEQAEMEEPVEPMAICYVQDDRGYERAVRHYNIEIAEYKNHLETLRRIPCHDSCRGLWVEGQMLEEGKDYDIMPPSDLPGCENEMYAFPLVPVKSEPDMPNLILTAFQNEPVNFLLSNALRHLTQDQQRELCNALHERLPIPASIEDEVERLYPYSDEDEMGKSIIDCMRSAHITAARQYMGEIDKARKEAKLELLWELIEEWQDARDNGEDITAPKFSFNDIEVDLYQKMEQVDPNDRKSKK